MMTNWIFFAAETAKEGGLFDLDATLPLMAVQFLILAAILNALFYKPLGKAIDERAQYVRQQISQAKEQKQKSLALAQEYEQGLKDVRKQSQEIIAAAQAEGQKIVADEVQAAQQEVIAERQKAAEQIEREKTEALASLQQQVDSLTQQIIERVMGTEFAR